jgi:hypothetical protein
LDAGTALQICQALSDVEASVEFAEAENVSSQELPIV